MKTTDDIYIQRQLGQIFTCILEWGQGTCKKSRLFPARAYTSLVVLVYSKGHRKTRSNKWKMSIVDYQIQFLDSIWKNWFNIEKPYYRDLIAIRCFFRDTLYNQGESDQLLFNPIVHGVSEQLGGGGTKFSEFKKKYQIFVQT